MAERGPAEDLEAELVHHLWVSGELSAEEARLRLGASAERVDATLAALRDAGLSASRRRPDGTWGHRLTAAGRRRAEAACCVERARLGRTLAAVLPEFEVSNRTLKELVHRWQIREVGGTRVPNDHRDHRYDERILAALGRLLAESASWLDRLAAASPRYGRFRERLTVALDRAGRGEGEYVCGLRVDSVHTIWWQLHADLLAVLGRARREEDA